MNRKEFPLLERDNELVYLDSACMSLKPQKVIEKINEYYKNYPGCSGRSSHRISRKATEELEKARERIAKLISTDKNDLMFTSGTTESINTVAQGHDFQRVFISEKEHNANRVVWQQLDTEVIEIPVDEELDLEFIKNNIRENDLLSLIHTSNLDGQTLDIEQAFDIAKDHNAYTLLDAAQSIPHKPFSVNEIKADFIAFSGHKMLGPTGTGALYVSKELQGKLSPLKYGGGAVNSATKKQADFKQYPKGFEPGLKDLAGYIGMGQAAQYLQQIGMKKIENHEQNLTERLVRSLREIKGVEIYNKGPGIVSMTFNSMNAREANEIFNKRNIMTRAGMHCAHPYHKKRNIPATLRASIYLYNNEKDIEEFIDVAKKISML